MDLTLGIPSPIILLFGSFILRKNGAKMLDVAIICIFIFILSLVGLLVMMPLIVRTTFTLPIHVWIVKNIWSVFRSFFGLFHSFTDGTGDLPIPPVINVESENSDSKPKKLT